MQQHFHLVQGEVQHLGDVPIAQAFELTQFKGLADPHRQLRQRRANRVADIRQVQRFVGFATGRARLEFGAFALDRIEVDAMNQAATLALAQEVEAEVPEHAIEVRREMPARLVARGVTEQLDEELLRDVLGEVMVAEDPPCVPPCGGLMTSHEFRQGDGVASAARHHQHVVGERASVGRGGRRSHGCPDERPRGAAAPAEVVDRGRSRTKVPSASPTAREGRPVGSPRPRRSGSAASAGRGSGAVGAVPHPSGPLKEARAAVRILVVDDDEAIRESLDVVLRFEHHDVVLAADGQAGLAALAADDGIELVFLDIKMPGRDGLEILVDIREKRPDVSVVMISGHGSIDTALEATRKGAFDFIEKPLDRDRVLLVLRNAHQVRRLQGENRVLRTRLSATSREMIGSSPALEKVRAILQRVAPTQARVLIIGENGSGKELAARLVHDLSDRSSGPFVDVNCAAIPSELLESELFGHEKGSFTGAVDQRKGKFEQANGGTLFLDEIGDMSLDAQAKVLRVIEEQRVQRVGGSQPIPVDVRLVAATNKDLAKEAKEGRFRDDLYYRLAVVPVLIPPLRDRAEDVPVLAISFLQQMASKMGVPVPELTDRAKSWLAHQPWPGNVRQLRNLMERALILVDGTTIDDRDLIGLGGPPAAVGGDGGMDLFRSARTFDEFREQSEKLFLQQRLQENDWNVSRTAEQLGMQRSNLYKKMERFGLK